MKKVMITGISGFVGSHLAKVLEKDYIVIGVDLQRYVDLFNLDNVAGVDVVVHLAALTDVRESMTQKDRYFRTNVLGTAHMTQLCMDYGAKMIFLSSAAIDDPNSSPYALSKYIATELVLYMQKAIKGVVLKPYNIYGDNPPANSIFHNYLTQGTLTQHGIGSDTRDFINVQDVCNIIKTAIDNDWQSGEPIAIGTGKPTTVKQITEWFAEYTGKKVVQQGVAPGIHHSVANIAALKKLYKVPFVTDIEKDIEALVKGQTQ